MLEGHILHRVMASDEERPGVGGPFALSIMSSRQGYEAKLISYGIRMISSVRLSWTPMRDVFKQSWRNA